MLGGNGLEWSAGTILLDYAYLGGIDILTTPVFDKSFYVKKTTPTTEIML